MFKIHRQPQGEGAVKKSIQKLLDPKKDVVTRLKHLKNIIDNSSNIEIQALFELHYSHIYFVFFENFLLAETNLRLKGSHRAQREELDAILVIFEQILVNLPELIHQRWQYHSIDTVIKRLLHSQNSLKVRREGIHFFLLWLRALGKNALPRTLLLYACLVPGFPPPTFSDGKPYSLEWLVNMPINEEHGVHQVEIMCLVPPPSGEKVPLDLTKYFLDSVLEFMVLKSQALRWKEERMKIECFSFLWDLFKEYYLPHAFTDFNFNTSIYNTALCLPEPRESVNYVLNVSDSGSIDPRIEVASGCSMLQARVSIIKWIIAFTGRFEKTQIQNNNADQSKDGSESKSSTPASSNPPQHLSVSSVQQIETEANSNTSTLTEKEPSISSVSSLDDKLRSSASAEEELVRDVLYSTRQNINIVHEMFRQAFMLPLTEVPTMRRVVKVYQEWIQEGDIPLFMEEIPKDMNMESEESHSDEGEEKEVLTRQKSTNSLRNVSYMRGQLHSVIDNALNTHVRAGPQTTLQLFITNSAHVFLVEPPRNATKLVQAQVDVCKRVLNLYRYMVMNVFLSEVTWQQLLRVLLHITRVMLQEATFDEPSVNKYETVAGRLAGPVFQTLIVSWIKANLFVQVSRDLWDELVDVLSSLTNWEELITEWAKNMETMTRVLARHVYKLELQDLPLDRLTEQKHKKQRKTGQNKKQSISSENSSRLNERSFSRGWSQDSVPGASDVESNKVSLHPPEEQISDDVISPPLHGRPRSSTMIGDTSNNPLLVLPHRGLSDTFASNQMVESEGLKRCNSASDIPNSDNTLHTSSCSTQRHRSDSDSQRGTNIHSSMDDKPNQGNGLHVAWQDNHQVHNYGSESVGGSTSISVNSLEEGDDMFEMLAQERLHAGSSKSFASSGETGEVVSIHSQDSAAIDADWNPWEHIEEDKQTENSSVDRFSTEDINVLHKASNYTKLAANGITVGVGNPVQSHGFNPEDFVTDPPHHPSSPLSLPLSHSPPAIPARVALPSNVNLFDINYLSPNLNNPQPTSPSDDSSVISDLTPTYPPPITLSHTQPLKSSCPDLTPPPHTCTTNLTPSNPDLHEDGASNSSGQDLNSPTSEFHQKQPSDAGSNELLMEEQHTPVFTSSLPSDVAPHDADDSFEKSDDTIQHLKVTKIVHSGAEDVVSVETYEMDVDTDAHDHEETPEEDLLATSTEDILLQHCSTPQIEVKQVNTLEDSTFDESLHKTTDTSHHNGLENCSIMAGGKKTGWFPDVAVALWRRLLGIMGDINKIEDGLIHELVFDYLLELWGILFKMRQNIGIPSETREVEESELVPPLRILAPWGFKATMAIRDTHKGGKLHAYELLCKMTLQREHDTPLEPEHLSQFYAVLHHGLHSPDNDIVNEIVRSCSQYFPSCLQASSLLLLDFIYACHAVAASQDLKAPRVEAQTILGSTLCFPNLYHNIPVLKPDVTEPSVTICNNVKDYVVEALLTSGKKEPSAAARCVALSSTGVWLYEELTTCHTRHSRVKEAINVLLVSLKFNNRTVASVACTQLHLLTHCSKELMENMPEMPSRIIEVMSLTVSALLNGTEAKNTDSGRQLLVSLLLCILDWCMAVPLELLTDTYGAESDKRLIRTVFKALQTAALGKPGHSAKHSYSLSDLASQDFDPNLQLDKVQEAPTGFSGRPKLNVPRNNTVKLGRDGAVSLAAHTVLSHLTNHLGHFPLARGCSLLACRVSEHHDGEDTPDELSAKLFNSPNVQFLIYNDTCLMSLVEIPAETDKPGEGATHDMCSSNRCVRFIMRDGGGKYCWDWSLLYGPADVEERNKPVKCEPLSTLASDIRQSSDAHCQSYLDYAKREEGRKCKVTYAEMPIYNKSEDPSANTDKLDTLLQYIGWSSPECQSRIGIPLNTYSPPPSVLSQDIEAAAIKQILHHHQQLGKSYSENSSATSWQGKAVHPPPPATNPLPFHLARLVCAQLGFLSRDNRGRVHLLKKNERLLRELKNLDSRHCRETHKVAVLYIASGQEDKLSILSNTGGSKDYEDFVAGLGWEVDLKVHCGFSGKLQSDGSTGKSAPYYATSTLEVIFHVATRFPSTNVTARNVKLKHLGNDEVHIVWSEHHRDYRRGIIPTEFGDVVIVIYPLRHGLFRVQIIKKPEVPYFGPLFDGAIVNARVLPVLVRETAINAGRAKRSQISLYQPFYEERTRYLRQIIEQFKDDRTFEDYSARLFSPVPQGPGSNPDASTKQSTTSHATDTIQLSSAPTPPSGPPGVDSSQLNSNNNNSTPDHEHHSFASYVKNIQHASAFNTAHSDTIQSSYHPTPTIEPPPTIQRSSKSHMTSSTRPTNINTTTRHSLKLPHTPLSTSAPSSQPTHRTPQKPSSLKSHLSFRSNLLPRNFGGGSQPHLAARDIPDIREAPDPPTFLPTTP
ncbi:ral GTPase-activating protein subunit alpha-1 isoform X2 [Ciona intestinalis]